MCWNLPSKKLQNMIGRACVLTHILILKLNLVMNHLFMAIIFTYMISWSKCI